VRTKDKTNSASRPDGSSKERKPALSKNNHPTVKPTALMAYLCRLITPTGGVVLDPYMGSGSTGKAAVREGFSFVGCELDEDYFQIAKSRVENAYYQ
jgi:DNA modification methylase